MEYHPFNNIIPAKFPTLLVIKFLFFRGHRINSGLGFLNGILLAHMTSSICMPTNILVYLVFGFRLNLAFQGYMT